MNDFSLFQMLEHAIQKPAEFAVPLGMLLFFTLAFPRLLAAVC